MHYDLTRRLAAEALGTFILVMAVVGSGIMAEQLAGGNVAIALLCNTIATGAVLFVIITIFAPVSGAHFNPAVSLVMLYRGALDLPTAAAYVVVQIVGGCVGAVLALYLNVFVGVVQAFEKLPFLSRLAPTQSEPPFLVAQLLVMAIFVGLGLGAVRRFRPTAARSG